MSPGMDRATKQWVELLTHLFVTSIVGACLFTTVFAIDAARAGPQQAAASATATAPTIAKAQDPAQAQELLLASEWLNYKRNFNKVYESPEEDARRFAMFKTQAISADGTADTAGLSEFADWSDEEFEQRMLGSFPYGVAPDWTNKPEAETFLRALLSNHSSWPPVPEQLDWRERPHRVGPVGNQGNCGSCWAFATTGVLEGQQLHFGLKSLVPLSQQFLMDCLPSRRGCDGYWPELAIEDVVKIGGIEADVNYPYLARGDTCHYNSSRSVMTVAGAAVLAVDSSTSRGLEGTIEDAIKTLVARYGPVAVVLDASAFKNVKKHHSFVSRAECRPDGRTNHAVLIVGYGGNPVHGDYWIIKNSWGTNWGSAGYINMPRGVNACRIGEYVAIATFDRWQPLLGGGVARASEDFPRGAL